MAEDSLWNPNVGTPQEGINEYDQSLNSNFDKPDVNEGLNPPNQNVAQSAQPEPSQEDSGMWGYTEQARLEQNQMSPNPIPDIPEAGRPGIDYDMGVVEKVGKSLMVGFGDMFQSVGDMVDFFDGSPSSAIELQVFGTQSDKPISDSLHNFAEYLQSYGDDVPGLTDLQDVTFESLLEPNFWMTSVARSLPFALSLMIPAGAAARGVGLLTKGAKFEAAAAAIAAGGRSIGLSANVSTALAATNLIKTGAATVAAGATSNFLEGAALAGQAMNEAIAQGVPVEDARLVGEQVMKDNLLSMGADIAQYALFMGAGGVGWAAKKGLQGLSGTVVGKTATAASKKAAIAALKNPGMTSVIKRASKILGAGAANGLTDGMIEQFQEVYQDWSVQRRIADAKGEDFPDYLEFFQDKEQLPTRVVSFATSLLMSGASNMIRTASENRVFLDKSLDDRLESHELLDIFNNEVEAGEYVTNKPTYTVDPTTGEPVEKDNITVLKAEQMQELGRDTAARTMIMNAVRGGVAETARVMEFLGAQLQAGTISESQMEMYQSTLTEVQDAVAKYPTQNLNNKQKTKLVAHAWLNNTVTQAIAKQIEDFDAQINEIQSLVDDGTQKQPWADGEIAGINVAKEQALKELKSIKSSSSETIRQIYKEAEQQTAKDVFQKNVAPLLDSAAQKASKGESLTSEEQEAVNNNKAAYKSYTESYTKVNAINKASEKLGKNISDYESTVNEDGGVEFKKSENGNTNVVTVDKDGNVTEKNSRTSDIVDEAVKNLEQEAEQNQDSETTEDDGGIDEAINKDESVEAETINTEINSKNSTAGAIKLALENNLDISSLIGKGSGKNKRILKADVQRLLDVVNNTPEGQDDGQGRLFNSLLEGAKLINKQVAKSAKKVFSKETYGSVVSYVKKHMAKRRIKNAFIIGQGSERVLQSLFADKAADGLISSAIMTDIAKKGTSFLGYMAGLSVFIDADSEYADETFFHENFHGFRKLYGHLPEVQAMMKAIVDQEIYNSIKMTYARNIVYSHKRIAGSGTILQKQALKVINRNRGANNKIATTINEYSQMKGESITFELHKEFYESSLEILKKEGYVELESTNQTNIQDEALTKLAGIYGAENQDMFIADPAKRKAYNENMKSWKSKIASAFTKEEAEFSLEKASKGQYKKGNGLDLEESFAQIKDLIATKEKRYSNLKESPSTLDIQALERDAVRKEIRTVLVGERDNIIKAAQDFKIKDLPKILEESSTGETDVDAQLEDIKSKIATSSAFRKLRVGLVQKILSPYTPGTEDFNTVREMLLTDEKYLSNIMNSFFQSKLQEDAINELNQQMIMFDNSTMEALRDDIDDESGAMLAQILDEHEHMSDKFYKIVRMFIEKEKYIGSNSISGRELKMVTNKENIMRGLKKLSLEYPTAEMFVTEAQELIKKRNFNPDVLEKVTGNFLHFLSTEIDSVGQDIFSAVLLQFRSMTTEKGLMIKDGTWALAMTTQMRRQINKAHNEVRENWEQSLTYRNEETRGEWLKSLAETRISSYNAIKFNSAQTRQDKDKYYKRINLRNTQEHYDIYRNYEARLDISRGLAKLLYETNGFNDKNVLDFINRNMLPSDMQLTSKQFKEQSIKDENGNIYSIQNYFTKERIEEMFWKTISVDSTLQEQYNEEIGLKRFQEIAERDVLNQILGNSFYNVEMSRHLKSLKVNISDEKKQEIRNTYQQKIADRFQESKWTNALQEQNEAYIVQAGSLLFYDFSVKKGKDIDGLTFESGKVDEDNPNSTSRTFFIKSGTDVNEVQVKKDGTYKVVKSYHKKEYGSVSLFVVTVQDNPDVRAVFQDLKGLSYSSKQIIGAILDDTNEGYMSNQISPESNQINKVLRKYFLEYHKDSLSDFIKENKSAFLSMFTYGKKAIHVNPYAMGMAQEDVLSPSYYELDYRTNDGDLDNVVDRNRMTNTSVTTADFNQILLAIENGNDTYHQVIKDYSDKSRRYYAKANTIKTREEAFRKLKDVVDYHKAKTQSIVDKHNDTNNDFDIHLVVGADIIAKLEESGYLIDQLEVDNRGALKGTRGQLNLLDDEIFKLTIDGENYDLSNIKEHSRMMSVLSGRVDLGGDSSTQLLASVNYFVNKYWLQDLNASTMEEQSFVMKNKRATGWIANHDSTFAGERVELIVFKDVEVSDADLVHKVQVLGPNGLETIDIEAATMDSASYVTEETANKIINKHGNIVDVKGSFKFVGYGRNIDNKKIASFFGQESNQFYAKGHTIVLNNKTEGPLKSIYKALKAREKYNIDNGLHLNNVMAYADDAMKKGLVYGKGDKQKNHLGLNEWSSLLKEGDEAVNNFINSYSYDEMSDNYGYDGRFFGIQGELDKDSKTATASKQMFSNIQLFLDHSNSEVRKAAQAIAISHISALEEQTNSSEVMTKSREDLLLGKIEDESFATTLKTLLEDGYTDMPAMRDALLKLLQAKIVKGATKLRTGGTLSLQESDVLYGWKAGEVKDVVQTNLALKPMSVIANTNSPKYKGKKKAEGYKVQVAEAAISSHMAEQLGLTSDDYDSKTGKIKDEKQVEFLATRIPAGSSGSTVVLKSAYVALKPGNTIAIHPTVSAILGSDLDGDMLHINTINTSENLSPLQEKTNTLTQSIMDMYKMPEIQNSLTKEVEFKSVMKATDSVLESGVSDIANDFSLLGAHQMYGQTKGNAPMIALIASQNLVYNYISKGNPSIMFEGKELSFKDSQGDIIPLNKELKTLDNNFTEDGGGTWYEITKWLNLVLDDGKNNKRAKYGFMKNTGSAFVMLLKMGIRPEKIASFMKSTQWNSNPLYMFYDEQENRLELESKLKEALLKRLPKKEATQLKNASHEKLIDAVYSKDGKLSFDLSYTNEIDQLALFLTFQKVNDDIFSISHFLSLDKAFSAEPIIAMSRHHKGLSALANQTSKDLSVDTISSKMGNEGSFFRRSVKLHSKLLNKLFTEDPEYSNGYTYGLLGAMQIDGLKDKSGVHSSSGVLNSEINTYSKTAKDNKGAEKHIGILTDGKKYELSEYEEANIRLAKALTLTRAAIHSNIDLKASIIDNVVNPKNTRIIEQHPYFNYLTKAEQYAIVTQKISEILDDPMFADNRFGEYVDDNVSYRFTYGHEIQKIRQENKVDKPSEPAQLSDAEVAETYMTGNEVIKKNKVVSFKPNMNKLMNTIDFTEQIRLIQKDFAALPGFVKDFFIANDFLATGWGSNGNSLTPFFNKSSLDKINTTYKSIKDESVSTFEKDIEKYAKKNPNYIKVKRKDKAQETTINARRMAAMAYMAIHGNDYAFDNNGLFKTSTEQIGSNEKNTVVTIEDNHFKSDRLVDKKQYLDKNLTKRPILYYEGFREINMLSAFSDLMTKDKTVQSNNIVYSNGTDDTVQYNQVPVWEFEKGQSYKGIGEKMSPEEYAQRKGYDMATISPDEKERLEKDYMIYEESTKLVSRLHDKLMQEGIDNVEGYRYNTLKGTEKNNQKNSIDAKFKKAQGLFREYNDALTHDKFILSDSLQQNLFKKTQGPIEANIDEYAADPLRRFLEFHFGNHISEYQISEWEFVNGKDFVESITQAEKDKDISDLNMWLSPGDFGKSKPAVAYINKNMKMTHMKYTRNLNLVTKEMNDKLEGLFRLKFGNSIEGKAKKFWMKYSPVGNKSIVDTLFENLVVHTTGLKKVIQKDGSVIYRDMSNTKLNPELFKSDGSIKDGVNTVYSRLAKEEQDYLKMYTKFTKFYAGLIENKDLYKQSKGATYIPGITSSKWETLQRRGLFGVYFQAFRGDNDLHDLQITAVNPLTGNTETLDYFSWKSIFLYRSKDDNSFVVKEVQGSDGSIRSTYDNISNNQSSVERIVSFEQIKERAKQIMKSGTDDANRPVMKSSPINDVMALESEAAMNRFNAKQSMSSSYLATMNLHKALLNYVQIFMFQHGTAYRDGETFKFLKFDIDDREFNETSFNLDDANKKENKLAFTGFEDKKQEIDAAIANLGSGKYYDSNIKIGTGKNKNAINYLQKVVKRHLINKERGFTFSGVEAESGITNFFVNWTMYIALGLNVPAAIGNVMIGKYNAWRQMGIGDMAKGEERFWGVSSEKGYDSNKMKKSRAMIEEFGILTYRAEEIAEGVGGSSLSSLIFAPMIAAEQWIQHAAFLGALTDEQWNAYELNKNGDLVLKKGANPITQQELAILERDVVNVQGRGYSETDSRMIQLYSLSNMTMQFKRWFPTFLRDRFGKEDIDDLGTLRMGSIPAVADFMAKMKDEGKQYDIRQWNEELKKLPKHKRDAVLRWWRGTQGVVIIAMLMGMAGMAMDDDEKKDNPAYEMMEKLLGDMLLIVNAPKLVYMGNIPALNTFKNLNLAVYHAAVGSEYSRKSKYGEKGDKKFVSNLAQLLPSPARIPLTLSEKKKRTI